jgi:hypothetical protein
VLPQPEKQQVRNGNMTFCKRGHPMDELNSYVYKDRTGRNCRACRACKALCDAQYRACQKTKATTQRSGAKIELALAPD